MLNPATLLFLKPKFIIRAILSLYLPSEYRASYLYILDRQCLVSKMKITLHFDAPQFMLVSL